jgi:hypothetical protein
VTHPVETIFEEMIDLVNQKASDYADDADPFSNFENTATLTGLSVPQVFHVMISIKTERLRQLMSGKAPNFESLEDTLKDLANYSALWIAWDRDITPTYSSGGPGFINYISPFQDTYEQDLTDLFNRGRL